MALTLEQAKSLKEVLGVAIPDDYIRQKELEAAFHKRCAGILAEFPEFKGHHSADRATAMFDSAGELAEKRDFAGALSVLAQLEQLLHSPPPAPAPAPAPPDIAAKAPAPPQEVKAETATQAAAPAEEKDETEEQKKEREKFLEDWAKLEAAMEEIDKVLSDKTYGEPPRGKISAPADGYLKAKKHVEQAEQQGDYQAASAGLAGLGKAISAFQAGRGEQLSEDRVVYFKRWQPIQGKALNYQIWIGGGKIAAGKEAAEFRRLNDLRGGLEFKFDYFNALAQLDALEDAIRKLEKVSSKQIAPLQKAQDDEEAERKRRLKILGQPEARGGSDEADKDKSKTNFVLRVKRLEEQTAQLDKQLKDKKFATEFAKAAAPYKKAKRGLMATATEEIKKDKPDYRDTGPACKAMNELELLIHDLEIEIQKAATAEINKLVKGGKAPVDKKILAKVRREATKHARRNPRALKGVDPALMDQMVGAVGDKAKSDDDKTLVKAALISRYDMVGAEGDLTSKALPRLYKIMGAVPESHTRENPMLKKVKRDRPGFRKDEVSSFYKGGYIYLSLERTGKNTEAFDQDKDIDPGFEVDGKQHNRFDAVTLHEIGHAVDDKANFMSNEGATPKYGGWGRHDVLEVAEAIGEAKGFFKDFPKLPCALLRTYLVHVCSGDEDPKTKMAGKLTVKDVGATIVTRDQLLGDPAMVQAEKDRKKFLEVDWTADETIAARNSANVDLGKMVKLKGMQRELVKLAIIKMVMPDSPARSLSASDAANAVLKQFCVSTTVDVDASAPDWAALAGHEAVEVCKAIRLKGNNGLWEKKADGAGKFKINGRVYQEAYKDDWVSYDITARKQGVSSYQFRAPGEWFAEAYSAYYMKKLPKAHPLHVWLAKQVPPGT